MHLTIKQKVIKVVKQPIIRIWFLGDGKYKIDVREDYTKKKAYEIMNYLRKVVLSEGKDK